MARLLTGAFWADLYDRVFLVRPKLTLLGMFIVFGICGYHARDFRMDASSDQLVLEHDADVVYFRDVVERFGAGDFVVVTYTPPEDLFSDASLDRLKRLREALKALPRVESVVTILDAPLLRNPAGTLKELKDNIKTLESPSADKKLAIIEFRSSPIYQGNLVSADLKSCAVQVNFTADSALDELTKRRYALREKRRAQSIAPAELVELAQVEREHRHMTDEHRSWRHEDIASIRRIIKGFRGDARIYLGGVPMIVDDIISYIKGDIRVFGIGMVLYELCLLWFIFRDPRFALMPLLAAVSSVVAMLGLLGWLHWDVTIVSSNFVSLQLVFTIEIAVHIITHYREVLRSHHGADGQRLARETVAASFKPLFYAVFTTIIGFTSLVFCDIVPVVSFGWMMFMGLTLTLIACFLIIPAALSLLPPSQLPPQHSESEFGHGSAMFFARLTERRPWVIYTVAAVFTLMIALGTTRLEVENSFISYFKKSTEISQGMHFIDQELGGTTPVDVILNFDKPAPPKAAPAAPAAPDEFSGFEEFEEKDADPAKYWFTAKKLEVIEQVHNYLESLQATGKVMSLGTAWKVAKQLNGGKPMDDFATALLFNSMPGRTKEVLIDPYVSVKDGQARVTTRIRDSMDHLRRDALLKQINKDLVEKVGLKPEEFRVSGLMVLYNNLLQSLYSSQSKTVIFTTLSLIPTFLLLWGSFKLAMIAILPNFIASMMVLGIMGLANIPLDVMTITIVAIVVGIAVNDTIVYIVRFGEEFPKDRDYVQTMYRCHGSVGHAIQYSTISNATGFLILGLSNFIPTILFGVLTAVALAVAMPMSLTLLPLLIVKLKPFGPEGFAHKKGGHGHQKEAHG